MSAFQQALQDYEARQGSLAQSMIAAKEAAREASGRIRASIINTNEGIASGNYQASITKAIGGELKDMGYDMSGKGLAIASIKGFKWGVAKYRGYRTGKLNSQWKEINAKRQQEQDDMADRTEAEPETMDDIRGGPDPAAPQPTTSATRNTTADAGGDEDLKFTMEDPGGPDFAPKPPAPTEDVTPDPGLEGIPDEETRLADIIDTRVAAGDFDEPQDLDLLAKIKADPLLNPALRAGDQAAGTGGRSIGDVAADFSKIEPGDLIAGGVGRSAAAVGGDVAAAGSDVAPGFRLLADVTGQQLPSNIASKLPDIQDLAAGRPTAPVPAPEQAPSNVPDLEDLIKGQAPEPAAPAPKAPAPDEGDPTGYENEGEFLEKMQGQAETQAENLADTAAQKGSQVAEGAEEAVEDLAPEITGELEGVGTGLGAKLADLVGGAIPIIGPLFDLAAIGTMAYSGYEQAKADVADPYAKIRGQIAAANIQVKDLQTQVGSDQFQEKLGVAQPSYGSLSAPAIDTAKMAAGAPAFHF